MREKEGYVHMVRVCTYSYEHMVHDSSMVIIRLDTDWDLWLRT
jgi:hypothetical protein